MWSLVTKKFGSSTWHHDAGHALANRNELTIHRAGPGVAPERVGRGSIYMHVDDTDALAEERGGGYRLCRAGGP
jgi:hypothetical protein